MQIVFIGCQILFSKKNEKKKKNEKEKSQICRLLN